MFSLVVFAAAVALTGAQQFQCPLENGHYRDPLQCDKYYNCIDGIAEEKLCPDGLVFDDASRARLESCTYHFQTSCPEGSTRQAPQPSGIECPRLNGYFEHEDPTNCHSYYQCTNGISEKRACHSGLVFDEFTGTCQWVSTGVRSNCNVRVDVLADGFSCPNVTQVHTNGQILDHALYIQPNDCRAFYVCTDGKYPSLSGCPEGTVFNDLTLACGAPEDVEGCQNYYEDSRGPQVADSSRPTLAL